jgi:serine/threonine protein kinase/tetratricopeptide (TPR) repeat protein
VKAERWERIEELYHAARQFDTDDRAAFINEACDGDEELRRSLEVLLKHGEHESFLNTPAFENAGHLLNEPFSTGFQLGPYEVVDTLGAGGMGEVYRARDARLNRLVAIKLIYSGIADETARRHLQQEARMASALNHPHILTVLEVGEFEGRQYLVTEFIDGGTLRTWAAEVKRSWRQAVELLVGVADGLACAHEAGIWHRDIKPDNILVTKSGYAKLADFGLAKLSQDAVPAAGMTISRSQPGLIIGTVPYTSPEQASGYAVDERSDIFSFGVVLYEVLAGRRPFQGDTGLQCLYSIIHNSPPSMAVLCSDIPEALRTLVEKALEKDPATRYQSMRALVTDLRELIRQSEGAVLSLPVHKRSSRRKSFAATVAAVVAALGFYWAVLRGHIAPSSGEVPHIRSLAVLPLANLSGDPGQEFFADGMTDAIIADLAQIEALNVISRTSVMRFKDPKTSLPEIARQLHVDAIVEGTVLRSGDRIRITAELIDATNDRHLFSKKYEKPMGDVFDLQNEIAQAIASEIQAMVTPEERGRLTRNRKVNPEAYIAYLHGRQYLDNVTEESLLKSVDLFRRAIQISPSYAEAHAALAASWIRLGDHGVVPFEEAHAEALKAANSAMQLNDSLAEVHLAMAEVHLQNWNWPAVEAEAQKALNANPGSVQVHSFYSNTLRHLGRSSESVAAAKRALDLDPFSPFAHEGLGDAYLSSRQYELAIQEYQRAIEINPNQAMSHDSLGWCYVYLGMYKKGIEEIVKSDGDGSDPDISPEIAYVRAVSGDKARARKTLEQLRRESQQFPIAAHHFALIYTGLGDTESALDWLEKAFGQHSNMMLWLKVDPRFDRLRQESRFQNLLHRVGLAI